MAGSLSHIVDDETGGLRLDLIENLGDAAEALEECYDIIAELTSHDETALSDACDHCGYRTPKAQPQTGLRWWEE